MRKMKFERTFKRFRWSSIIVYDTYGEYIDNTWDEIPPVEHRTIQAIPLLDTPLELQHLPEGASSTTTLKLITKAALYWIDVVQPLRYREEEDKAVDEKEDTSHLQSYVQWKNCIWRVVGSNCFLGNVNELQIYSLERYIR